MATKKGESEGDGSTHSNSGSNFDQSSVYACMEISQ
jgi:hypothetical protein